jgi:uncharacterized ferritin-like protein (DUF455 family)
VAEDECRHYELLRRRLEEMGSHYGAFPGHEALWDSATATAHSLPARLAIEHAVHEARGCVCGIAPRLYVPLSWTSRVSN